MKLGSAQLRTGYTQVIGRCEHCVFRKSCGGKWAFGGEMWNCFDLHPYRAGDDDVCPANPEFAAMLAEVNGLMFEWLDVIHQRRTGLPLYVPHLSHQYGRLYPLPWPVVALTPYQLFRRPNGRYQMVVEGAAELREFFRLAPETRIVLRGTDLDRPLETYWAHRRIDEAAEQIALIGVDLMVAPNFSHFGDATRTDHLYNRKRQLICAGELNRAGVNVAPHLSAAVDADWEFWGCYLAERPEISVVAKEFQTGNRAALPSLHCLERIATIQNRLGRPLHPILIGGAHLIEAAAMRFETFTVLDSRPFQNALHRYVFEPKGRRPRWMSSQQLPGLGVDGLMLTNLQRYERWLAVRATSAVGVRFLHARRTA